MVTTFVTIWLLHMAALLTPGANVVLVSHLAASGDRTSAMYAAVGITIGTAVWSSAAVLGVGAIFAAVPSTRLFLQVAGAIYLLYVASRLWRSRAPITSNLGSLPAAQALRLGLLTNLSNPKVALFFGSVFSAALPAHPSAVVLSSAVMLVVVNALCWHILLAYLFSRAEVQTTYAAHRGLFARMAGVVVGALGLSLLVAAMREAWW